ncbi:MAG: bifunctional diaminohydroxyphosphoribosylaminopyrimidine deaminase/5-amino-6-(5-phosphoribosylamino)uracil reductase RibD [Spirochaetales bacterium]|nr:bifunctional diaminohydroxyphosphoribosylaminopyrimidine deaminase/5-amino-6-(5-phosphoribosylamino)uracil reductase RibD [Spirochaetales bacterium]
MQKTDSVDEKYMRQALKLARRGLGKVSPNPMVGAVIVKKGRVIGQGFHRYFGGNHAEIDALEHAAENVAGATMYVTLEPCSHYGKTPPCADAVISKKLGKVVIGMVDPDARVSGRGLAKLKEAGIETVTGVLGPECRALNETYVKHRSTGLPFVTVKWAQTLDGRIATARGDSRWISCPESLKLAHRLRATHDAILVGAGTVIKDNPELTARLVRGRDPVRVVLDSRLRIPRDARVLTDQKAARTLVAATPAADKDRLSDLNAMGIEVLIVPADARDRVDLPALLKKLGEREISSLLVEGGGETITSFLRLKLADKLVVIIAPRIMGAGTDAVGELNITEVSKSLDLTFTRVYRSGEDLVAEGSPA